MRLVKADKAAQSLQRRGPMNRNVCLLAAGVVLVAVITVLTTGRTSVGQTRTAEPEKPVAVKTADTKESKRPDDEAAIRKASAGFLKVVEKGDAKAVAESWTEDGEYIGDDGTTIRGRAAIEAAYAKAFAKKKNPKVEITIETIRFLSKDTAIEEGYAKTYREGPDQP